ARGELRAGGPGRAAELAEALGERLSGSLGGGGQWSGSRRVLGGVRVERDRERQGRVSPLAVAVDRGGILDIEQACGSASLPGIRCPYLRAPGDAADERSGVTVRFPRSFPRRVRSPEKGCNHADSARRS